MDKVYLAALQMIPGIGSSRLNALIDYFGSAQAAWRASGSDLLLSKCLDEATCNKLRSSREFIDVDKIAIDWERKSIKICLMGDEDYPPLLRAIFNPPYLLYYRGQIPVDSLFVGIVGSRRASPYGRNMAQMLAADLAAAGIAVVSGAARGIDTAAHSGALSNGRTMAVLGCGVDIVYPRENARLLDQIAATGAVISEYPPGTPVHPGQFPMRNRIISGMSRGVLVVEAAERSGALITADYALEEGRDVFAVPGSVFSASSRGAHRLIKQGAKLVECAADVLEEYQVAPRANQRASLELDERENKVYSMLKSDNPISVEEIVTKTNLMTSDVTYILLQLELRGLISAYGGQRYMRAGGGICE